MGRHRVLMTHQCTFELDLDGQVTCTQCGAMDDDMDPVKFDLDVWEIFR